MHLVGLAILGKSNEPLYLCDCTRLKEEAAHSSSDVYSQDAKNKEFPVYTVQPEENVFGEFSSAKGQRESLSLSQQLMIHTALDPLEERIGKSNPDGSMPLRKTIYGSATALSSHWTGLLSEIDGKYLVYGHVTATNIKFLAIIDAQPHKDAPVRAFLQNIHQIYIQHIMNPFNSLRGQIESTTFDKRVKEAVRQYANMSNPLGMD